MKRILALLLILVLTLCACGTPAASETVPQETISEAEGWKANPLSVIDDNYRTYYEIFVYSFRDSNGDGVGDLNGITEKLDYIEDLGFNGIWLMPIMPSPTYHKYDTTDYCAIDPEYGTLEDFQNLLDACHARGINVIIDLALNHSSVQHPWFKEASAYLSTLPDGAEPDPAECSYVEYYNFNREGGAGFALVPGTTDWFYECRFWSGMPDMNLESEAVRAEFENAAKFWMDMGVDGFRLDAVKEYITGSVQGNIEILTWFNDYVKSLNPDAYLVCECWENKETYAQYYTSGVDSMFDFNFGDASGVIAKVVKGSSPASSYGEQLAACEALYASYSPSFINAPFYTNHDMGRSAGYYAGDWSEAQTKMGNAMNILMSGNVFVYYGEELGMKGSGADENKRLAMYWSADENAAGMCDGPSGADDVKMKFGPLEEQEADETSVYNYVKDAILLRNQNPAIARGTVTYLENDSNDQICVITKSYEGTELVLVFNTSAASAAVSLAGSGELELLGELLTGEEEVTRDGDAITMPAYSILLLG